MLPWVTRALDAAFPRHPHRVARVLGGLCIVPGMPVVKSQDPLCKLLQEDLMTARISYIQTPDPKEPIDHPLNRSVDNGSHKPQTISPC